MVLFPGFQALDAFGPLDALNLLSFHRQISLSVIAESLEPVSTRLAGASGNPTNSACEQRVVPTHTFDNVPSLDVLIVPGGVGTRQPGIRSVADFVAKIYPSLQYLIAVCTGSGVVAMAGILDGKRATTNKNRFQVTAAYGPKVEWIWHARWVVDGNIWTSAGISAGIDVTLAFLEKTYGRELATTITNSLEYDRHENSDWDPFSERIDRENTAE